MERVRVCTRVCTCVCGFHAYVLGALQPNSVFTIPPVTYSPMTLTDG